MIVLDTNVLSELMKDAPSEAVIAWAARHNSQLAITSISLAELWYGVERLPQGKRRQALAAAIARLDIEFAGRIYAFDSATAPLYGQVMAAAQGKGRPMSALDGQIAAIALFQKAKLATRNVRDFATTGLAVINPWK